MSGAPSIEVVQFLRGPTEGGFSLERMFEDIRRALPVDVDAKLVVSRFANSGFFPRLRNAIDVWRQRGEVNHVLGDTQYLAWFLPRRRTLMTVHDCVSLERLKGWRLRVFWLFGYWWPLKRSGRVVVVSEFTRKSLQSWVRYPDSRVATIPPPLSGEFTYSPPRPHGEWSRLLHVGTAPNKNLSRVIEAVAGLDVTLVVVGKLSGDCRAALEHHGVSFEVHERLHREGLVEQYRQADVLVFASIYEGFGMPIIEAQATGRPVVTSNVASMPEAAGGAACLVDPFDAASIRAGIERVLGDASYAAALIERGRANARQYETARVAARYAAIYRQIAAEAGHGR